MRGLGDGSFKSDGILVMRVVMIFKMASSSKYFDSEALCQYPGKLITHPLPGLLLSSSL